MRSAQAIDQLRGKPPLFECGFEENADVVGAINAQGRARLVRLWRGGVGCFSEAGTPEGRVRGLAGIPASSGRGGCQEFNKCSMSFMSSIIRSLLRDRFGAGVGGVG